MKPETQLDNPNQRLLYEYLSKLKIFAIPSSMC